MSSLSRSFKPPSYLSPYRRPNMPGRTLSASSEKSDDGSEHAATSGQTTPTWLPTSPYRRYGTPPISQSVAGSAPGTMPSRGALAAGQSASEQTAGRSNDAASAPIAIEIPRIKRISSASVRTPPEPLSARGDLPGGYFPMHEDPSSRVHRTHPFHSPDRASLRDRTVADFSAAPEADSRSQHQMPSSMSTHNSIPVASYIPSGCHDTPLPMGKYYPSNYESHQKAQVTRAKSATVPSSSIPRDQREGYDGSPRLSMPSHEPDARRKLQLQQYQRDMIAQASLAANELIASSGRGRAGPPKLGSLPGKSLTFGPPFHNPSAPKLHPLGSPGPVTPMELETSRGGNGYFENMSRGDGPQK